MANIDITFPAQTGKTYRLFPDERYDVSMSTWASNAKTATEQSSPNLGRYDATVDDTYRYWMVFEGASQPAGFHLWSYIVDIYNGAIRSDDLDTSALAAINKNRRA